MSRKVFLTPEESSAFGSALEAFNGRINKPKALLDRIDAEIARITKMRAECVESIQSAQDTFYTRMFTALAAHGVTKVTDWRVHLLTSPAIFEYVEKGQLITLSQPTQIAPPRPTPVPPALVAVEDEIEPKPRPHGRRGELR